MADRSWGLPPAPPSTATGDRTARRVEERAARSAERMAEREARPKRRTSGAVARTGDTRVERDVRHYATAADPERIRILARRGASVEALAATFRIPVEDVEAALNDA